MYIRDIRFLQLNVFWSKNLSQFSNATCANCRTSVYQHSLCKFIYLNVYKVASEGACPIKLWRLNQFIAFNGFSVGQGGAVIAYPTIVLLFTTYGLSHLSAHSSKMVKFITPTTPSTQGWASMTRRVGLTTFEARITRIVGGRGLLGESV